MFSKITNWLTYVEHDVEAIIETFTNTVERLEAAAVAKLKEAEQHAAEAMHFQNLSGVAEDASKRATAVAAKIKELVA